MTTDKIKEVIAELQRQSTDVSWKDAEPVGSICKAHTKSQQGPWCKEILLYSPDNTGDSPEHRVMLYTHPKAATVPDQLPIILELPDGDSRVTKIWWDEVRGDKRVLSISVDEAAPALSAANKGKENDY